MCNKSSCPAWAVQQRYFKCDGTQAFQCGTPLSPRLHLLNRVLQLARLLHLHHDVAASQQLTPV